MKWQDALKRTDIVGGELETQEGDGYIYRGPIKSIELKDGEVSIELEWCAKKILDVRHNSDFERWRAHNVVSFSITAETTTPRELSGNRLMIRPPMLGTWVIYPKGGSKLDPAKVLDLKIMQSLKESE